MLCFTPIFSPPPPQKKKKRKPHTFAASSRSMNKRINGHARNVIPKWDFIWGFREDLIAYLVPMCRPRKRPLQTIMTTPQLSNHTQPSLPTNPSIHPSIHLHLSKETDTPNPDSATASTSTPHSRSTPPPSPYPSAHPPT